MELVCVSTAAEWSAPGLTPELSSVSETEGENEIATAPDGASQ